MANGPFPPIAAIVELARLKEQKKQNRADRIQASISDLSKVVQTSVKAAADAKLKQKELTENTAISLAKILPAEQASQLLQNVFGEQFAGVPLQVKKPGIDVSPTMRSVLGKTLPEGTPLPEEGATIPEQELSFYKGIGGVDSDKNKLQIENLKKRGQLYDAQIAKAKAMTNRYRKGEDISKDLLQQYDDLQQSLSRVSKMISDPFITEDQLKLAQSNQSKLIQQKALLDPVVRDITQKRVSEYKGIKGPEGPVSTEAPTRSQGGQVLTEDAATSIILDLKSKGISPDEIRRMLQEAGHNPALYESLLR